MSSRPSGTVTFFFTDIEGSTKLWEKFPEAMKTALVRHDALMRHAIESNGGYVFKTMGDAFCAAFQTASPAISAAIAAQRTLNEQRWSETDPIRVRIAVNTGSADERGGDFFGPAVNRAARLMAVGFGGQVLVSGTTHELVRDALQDGISFRDLGQHRLKDLVRPEHILQLVSPGLPSEFPPIKSLNILPNNLPIQLTSFVGRENQIDEVKRLSARARLLTLVGAGGTGKSRLSLQVGADMMDNFSDGVWFVELAPISDPAAVPQAVAVALQVREEHGRSLVETLKDFISTKNVLLILDNCEHLIQASANLVGLLLQSCPTLRILATSREPLGVPGETIYRVPSLSVPDPEKPSSIAELAQYEAVQLFIERAVSLKTSFALTDQNALAVAQICRRLDGIPLAIELGAARITAMSVEKIASRLDDMFNLLSMGSRMHLPRQQTLGALIEWSHNLLSEHERILFRRLSIFLGGCSLEAAEHVGCGDELEKNDVMNLLALLVNKSLVITDDASGGEARYRMLETIRQFAFLKLRQAGEESTQRSRHLDWFLNLAETAEPNLRGAEQARWLNELEIEADNIAAALDFSIAEKKTVLSMRFASALRQFWNVRGFWTEGRERLGRVLALQDTGTDPVLRTKVLNGIGYLALQQGDLPIARRYFEESQSKGKESDDQREVASSFLGLANIAQMQNDYITARSLFSRAIELYVLVGDRQGIAVGRLALGRLTFNLGEYAEACSHFESALPIFREFGDKRDVGKILGNLGLIAFYERDFATARALCKESLEIRRELKDKSGIAYQLNNLGWIALRQGEHDKAKSFFVESLTLFAQIKSKRMVADTLYGLGSVATVEQKPRDAARLVGAAQSLLDGLGVEIEGANRKEYDRSISAVRAAMDEPSFNMAWAEGKAMTLEDAVAFASGEPRK